MAVKRSPSTQFTFAGRRSKLSRRKSSFRRADLERLEDRQLLAVVGVPAEQLGAPANGYLDNLYSDWLAHESSGASGSFAQDQPSYYQFRGDSIAIEIYAPGNTAEIASQLETVGLSSARWAGEHIGGMAPLDKLSAITNTEGVQYVSVAFAPQFRTGSVDSQGDVALQSDEVRSALGFDGTGVNVGVISNSYNQDNSAATNAADDVASGDLPGDVNVVQDSFSNDADDEGRAMLQVIHDVAPGASLSFHNVSGEEATGADIVSFVNAIDALEANGVDVIVDDVYFRQEPFFQDGQVARKIDEVVNQPTNPITYISAAGNSGDNSYEAEFVDSGTDAAGSVGGSGLNEWHDFDPGAGVAELQNITVPFGSTVSIVMQHAEPFSSLGGSGQQNDYNMVLIDPSQGAFDPASSNTSHPAFTAQSTSAQNGDDPIEIIEFINDDPSNDQFQIGLLRGNNTSNLLMKYVITLTDGQGRPSIDTFPTNSSTLVGHANAAGAIAVGAAFYANTPEFNGGDPPQVNDYSSKGGTTIRFDQNNMPVTESRNPLTVVGPDGVNNTFFGETDVESDGSPNFFGTSSAAAHVAGVVALMLQADAGQTPAENRSILSSTAIDILERVDPETDPPTVVTPGASMGFDDYSGFGFVDALAAVQQSIGIPTIDLDSNTPGFDSTATFSEQASTPVSIAGPVEIVDPDDTMLTSATVQITNRPDGTEEILAVTDSGGITSVYDANTGTLTLTGPAPITDFQTVLGTLTYDNEAANPDGTTRQVEVSITDPSTNTSTSIASVMIELFNDPPVAMDDPYTVAEDMTLDIAAPGVLSNDDDPEGDSITADLVTDVSNGSLTLNDDGSFTYEPDMNFNGSDSFTYVANDGEADSAPATVTITVDPQNDAPVADPDNYQTPEDQTLTIDMTSLGVLANDMDVDGDSLTATLVNGQPANGSVSLNSDGTFTYTPNADFFGTDSFEYTASDPSSASSQPTTVNITVNPVNDAPVADPDDYMVDEDMTLPVNAPGVLGNDTDAENDPLTANLVTDVSNGTLSLNSNGSFTYTPNADFSGTDSFVYQADDGPANSGNTTVTITVNEVNDPPKATADDYETPEDMDLSVSAAMGVLANDNDTEGDSLTASLVSDVTNGTLTLDADGSFDYSPDVDFFGNDSFTYVANDGATDSDPATVTITVTAVNDLPEADDDTYSAIEDMQLPVDAPGVLGNDTDEEGDSLTANLVDDVSNGTLTLNSNGSFTYTPDADFQGTDSFTYRANDGSGDSNLATVTINVAEENDPPEATNDSYTTSEDVDLSVNAAMGVLDNDTDPEDDTLSANLVSDVSNGTLTLNANGSFDYSPNANFSGSDSFTYQANDGLSDSNLATVTITVTAVNDPPVAVDDTVMTMEDSSVTFDPRGNDTDAEDDTLTITNAAGASNGTVTFTGTSVTYSPDANFSGSDSFNYTISDGNGGTDSEVVSVTVNAVNDVPVFTSSEVTMGQENTPYSYTITTNDVDNLATELTLDAPTLPSWLTFTDNGNGTATLTGTPQAADIGSHPVSLTVSDPDNASSTQSFTIEVVADNVPPTANPDSYMFDEDDFPQTLTVLDNDTTAPDTGETLTITGVSGVGLGHSVTITGSPGSQTLTYSAPENFFGTETFTYTISDGTAPDSTDTAAVTIVVSEVNDPPTANDDTFFGIAEDSVDNPLDVLANDTIAPDVGETLTITGVSTPDNGGSVTINDNGTPGVTDDDFLDYSPAVGFRGTETFMYTIADGRGGTDTATVNIAVFNQPVFQVASTGDVFAIGSDNSDRIIFFPSNSFNGITVRYNNQFFGPFILQPDSTLNADGRGGNDSIIVAGSTDRIANFEGGVGNDYLAGSIGDDTLSGGLGNDVILGSEGDNLLFGGEGNDRMEGRTGDDTLDGGDGNDRLNGSSGNDTLRGGNGNDALNGGLDDDLLFGELGADLLTGGNGNDVLVGGDDADTLFGRAGNDVLIGGTGSDRLRGSSGDDLLLGASSDYDEDEAALLAILAEWSSGNDFSTRIMNIRTGSTTGGNPLSTTAGSTDDGSIDDLTGDTGNDWFLGFSDSVRDQRSDDVVER